MRANLSLTFPLLSLLAATAAAQSPTLRVALCGAASTSNTACQWVDVQTRLTATNLFATVDIINVTTTGGGTPSLATLLQYDALLCYTNSTPANNNTWGDVLADYVDAGGGVVVAVFANSTTTAGRNIGGRWQNAYEVILDQSGNASGAAGLGNVLVPTHPVMAGVTAFTGGTIGSRPVGTALATGATLVAEWTDGKVLVAEGANPRRIDLGFYPPNASCSQSGWSTGGDQLMANALVHVANGGRFRPYGAGCAGSLGVPSLAAATGSRPVLGTVYTLDVTNLPLGAGFMALGFSDTQNPPFALPLDLTPFGLPGCSLLAEALATQLLTGTGTSASWLIGLPLDPSLQGLTFFNQAFALDPAANAVGLTVSNAGASRIGL